MNTSGRSALHPRVRAERTALSDDTKAAGDICFFGGPADSGDFCPPVSLVVLTDDQITYEGAVAALSGYPDIEVLPWESHGRAQVVIAFAEDVSNTTLGRIERFTATRPNIPVVLVAESVSEPRLMRAIGLGVVSVLFHRQASFARIKEAVVAARKGQSDVPPQFLGPLIRHLRRLDQRGSDGGLGLNTREISVLGLLSDGLDTAQIARRLNYSERTIKNIIHAIVNNLGVSNRTHAVAYVIRAGLL
ncbi:helix-turn-helix transcriptional regulator [Streptomyces mirabilis]|uniref:helix-turn-helix transcriptional regulator n=1 Tax=Streptomyces mirabilis TaxID=68239 RepID=UPI0033AE8FE8